MQSVSSGYSPGPTAGVREPLRFHQITLAPPQCFFRSFALGDVHHRPYELDAVRFIAYDMSNNMEMFDGTIRHPQTIFMLKILAILRRAFDRLFHEGRVLRMNPLEDKFHGRSRRRVILKDSKGLL